MTISIETLTFQDLLQPEILRNPYPLFRRLRLESPMHEDPSGAGWMVTRYDDVTAILSDPRFSAERVMSREGESSGESTVQAALVRQMLFLDPPEHTRLRKAFTRALSARRLKSLHPHILQLVTGLLDVAENAGPTVDFIKDFAVPLPVTVIAQLIGVPANDRDQLREWSIAFGRLISGRTLSASETFEAQLAVLELMDYFRVLVEERRRRPQDDMVSDLVNVQVSGEQISTKDLCINLVLLLAAGHGTTTHLLGNGLLALLRHPEQWRLLVNEPAVSPSAVNELLRFDAPVQTTSREALEDVQLHDKLIRKGQRVRALFGSANHDESHFIEPDKLDLRREGTRLLSFGHGIHTCLGAALARLEAQIAFPEIARRFPGLTLLEEDPQWTQSLSFRGLQRLAIRLSNQPHKSTS